MRINEYSPDVGRTKSLVRENVRRLNTVMGRRGVDAVFVITIDNWRYLTGLPIHYSVAYSAVNAAILVSGAELPVLLPLDFFASRIRVAAPWYRIVAELPFHGTAEPLQPTGAKKWPPLIGDAFRQLGLQRTTIAMDPGTPWTLSEQIRQRCQENRFVDAAEILSEARMIKNVHEIRSIRRACEIADQGLEAALDFAKAGVTESEVADLIQRVFAREGAEYATMSPAVFAGDHPLLGYICSSDRVLRNDEIVRLDIACSVDGYCCCLARSGFIGEPTSEIANAYQLLCAALQAGVEAVAPGVSNTEIHETMHQRLQRDSGNKYGLDWYGGHGIGLGLHEQPLLGRAGYVDEIVLQAGMTFALEPSIFMPGHGWIGLEDNVAVTEGGVDLLNHAKFTLATDRQSLIR